MPAARYRSFSSLIRTSTSPCTMPSTAFSEPSGVVAISVTRSPGLRAAGPTARPVPSSDAVSAVARRGSEPADDQLARARRRGLGLRDRLRRRGTGRTSRPFDARPTKSIRGRTDATAGSARDERARAARAFGIPNSSVVSSARADGPPVDDLELPDAPDRPLPQPLERLGDEAARERERREPERDDDAHEEPSAASAGRGCATRARRRSRRLPLSDSIAAVVQRDDAPRPRDDPRVVRREEKGDARASRRVRASGPGSPRRCASRGSPSARRRRRPPAGWRALARSRRAAAARPRAGPAGRRPFRRARRRRAAPSPARAAPSAGARASAIGYSTFSSRREDGDQVERLEDEAEPVAPQVRALVLRKPRGVPSVDARATPESGRSSSPSRFSSVVLPEPLGPWSATNSPVADRERHVRGPRGPSVGSDRVGPRQVARVEERRARAMAPRILRHAVYAFGPGGGTTIAGHGHRGSS